MPVRHLRVLTVLVAVIAGLLALIGTPTAGAAGPSSVRACWSDGKKEADGD